jgi:hypothetical protein
MIIKPIALSEASAGLLILPPLFPVESFRRRLMRMDAKQDIKLSQDKMDSFDQAKVREWLVSEPKCCEEGRCLQRWFQERPVKIAVQVRALFERRCHGITRNDNDLIKHMPLSDSGHAASL